MPPSSWNLKNGEVRGNLLSNGDGKRAGEEMEEGRGAPFELTRIV